MAQEKLLLFFGGPADGKLIKASEQEGKSVFNYYKPPDIDGFFLNQNPNVPKSKTETIDIYLRKSFIAYGVKFEVLVYSETAEKPMNKLSENIQDALFPVRVVESLDHLSYLIKNNNICNMSVSLSNMRALFGKHHLSIYLEVPDIYNYLVDPDKDICVFFQGSDEQSLNNKDQ